jgi:DNA helicase-2/ATP-dependent DNA helicase PcrA
MAGKINQDQARAASNASGHAMVLAGPGTGKTSTLVARHSFLRARGRDPLGIVAVTFTQKAAEELKARIGDNAPPQSWIGTFHGLCTRLLKRFSDEAGLRKSFKILDPKAQRKLLSDIGIKWESDDGDITDIIGRWKDSLVSPDEAAGSALAPGDVGNTTMRLAAEHYAAYEEELDRRGDVDFADLVVMGWKLIESSEPVREFIRTRFSDILVDEFQDVNRVQFELVMAIAALNTNVWAVADDDQALYGWRGGDVRLTVDFANYFKGAKYYKLTENYRCDPAILLSAMSLIEHNKVRIKKNLKATRPHLPANLVRMRGFGTEHDEAEWVADDIRKRIAAGLRPRDVCILFRTASIAPAIQQALERAGIPFVLTGAVSFWEMAEMTAVIEMLSEIETGIPGAQSARHRQCRELTVTFKGLGPDKTASSVGAVLRDKPPAGVSAERAASWFDVVEAASAIASKFSTVEEFRRHVLEKSAKSSSENINAVAMSTIHSSKGLEWAHVVIAGCEGSMMPHHRSQDIEEERRLLYVALTRSKGAADLTFVKFRFGRQQAPSPFLSEIASVRGGAAVWVGGEAPDAPRQASSPARRNAQTPAVQAPKSDGGPKVYRRRGGRSLIPPGEE